MKQDTPCKTIELNGEPLVPLKANELRIGNWVIMKMLDGTHVLTTVPAVGIAMVEAGKCEVFGVQVTADILVKCGLKRTNDEQDYCWTIELIGGKVLLFELLLNRNIIGVKSGYGKYNDEIMLFESPFLHQLQNGHFWLTRKELICNL